MAAADQHVVVLVLGDIGRSPRMQYHAVSLSKMKRTKVSLVGFKGEKCIEAVEKSDRIQQVTFSPFTRAVPRALFLFYAPFKVIFQVRYINYILWMHLTLLIDRFSSCFGFCCGQCLDQQRS